MIDQPLLFLSAAIVLNLSPGPDVVYVIGRTLSQGRKAGFLSILGVCSGATLHILLAALGISIIFKTSAVAYNILLYAGAAYLAFLGVQTIRSRSSLKLNKTKRSTSMWNVYFKGMLVDVLNPKVAIFFMALLPQFIRPDEPNYFVTFLLLGAVVIAGAMIWETVLVLLAHQIQTRFFGNSTERRLLNWILGLIFIAIALNLVLF